MRLVVVRLTTIIALTSTVLVLGSCGNPPPPATEGGWREVPGSPLSARSVAVGLWTGSEALLIGGQDDPPCPENADCGLDRTPLADGAAVDPATGAWRPIAAAPFPFAAAQGVMAGGTAYVAPHTGDVLAYHPGEDRWERFAAPGPEYFQMLAAGDRLVVVQDSDEPHGYGPVQVLDRTARTWTALPADPLGPSYDRHAAWAAGLLVLFSHPLVPDPGVRPSLVRAATFDFAAGVWTRLPDLPMLATGPWLYERDLLFNPSIGREDGGQVNPWPTSYPYGGTLDPVRGVAGDLPDAPGGTRQNPVGVRGTTSALYLHDEGRFYDAVQGRWIGLPSVPERARERTVVTAGTRLFTYGGVTGDRYSTRAWFW